jgi:hypothetical protein
MTQEQIDTALGKIVRETIAKALPLDFSRALKRYITVDLVGFGEVLVAIEVCGTQLETQH